MGIERRLQALARLTSQVVWTTGPGGRMEGVQPGWAAFTGQALGDYQGFGWAAAVHPEDALPTLDAWNRCVADRRQFLFEHRVRRHDGVYRLFRINAAPVLDDAGCLREWVGIHNDITEREQQEERAGRIAGVGGWSLNPADGAVHWSNETCRIHELEPGNRPSFEAALDFYTPASRRVIEAACRQCIADATRFDEELQMVTAKGRQIRVRSVGEAQMENGSVSRIFGAFQDITTRKLAEQELFDQHELLRVTLESIGDAVITTDARRRVRSLNPIASRLTGRSADVARGLPVEQVFNIVDARSPVLVFRDVSERQRAARALSSANERFALAADAAGIGVWEWDLSSNLLHWDDQMYRLYGRQRIAGEEAYSLWTSSLHVDDRVRAEQEINEAVRGGANFDSEFRIVLPGGEIRHVKAAAQIQTDGADRAIRMIGVNFDITARKEAELGLQHTSSLLRRVLDSANDLSIIATTPDLKIRVFNKGAERLLGYAGAEIIDSATPLAFHDAAEVQARGLELSTLLGRPVQGEGVFTEPAALDLAREWTYIRKDQHRVTVQLNVSAMFDDSGILRGYLAVARDITRDREHDRSLEAAKSEAERANAAKSEFLANMSHEIRTPLNAIIGLGYLLDQTTLSEDQRQFVTKIQFAGRALLSVINNVLDLSKIEAGEMVLEDESFDLPELVREVLAMLAPQAAGKGIELLIPPLSDLSRTLRGDSTRLRQVLTNLLSNSIKFTNSGQVELVLLCTEQDSERMRLRCEVKDTGIGIDAAALERLFTPFSQADASTTRRYGGTGLGLSIARRCVELMGGQIGVTSTVALGSTFWFEIPLRKAGSIDSRHIANGGLSFRLLVASSEEEAQDGLGAMVRALGWSTQMVATDARLLEVMSSTPPDAWPDVIILDLQLPATDEAALIARLQRASTQAELPPVIVIAGLVESYAQHQTSMRATDAFLVRPVTSSALFNAINSAVWKQQDTHDRMGQSTNIDELHTQWLAGVRVLVVDDSSINLEVAQRILERQGATVVTCSDGRAAVEYVRINHQSLDLVLIDVQMPILDGNEATRQIRNELALPSLPIVALTAGALVGERQRSIEAGMNDFVSKPFDPLVLIRKVRSLVEQARGAPIPMVFVDRKRASHAADRLLIPSIDATVVQQMFGDDQALFERVLLRMLRDNADLALPSILSDDRTARTLFKGRVHQLKGSAGMIGATGVARLAAAAETALQHNLQMGFVEKIMQQLAAAMTTLREETDLFLARQPKPRATAALDCISPPDIGAMEIEALCTLLECQNLEAVNRFDLLSRSLRELMDAKRFERLHLAIDNLDFPLAATVLRDGMVPVT